MPYSEDQPAERNVNTEGGDYAEGHIDKHQGSFVEDKRQGVFWERARIPLAVIVLALVIIVTGIVITAGASLEGFRRQLQSVGVLAPDPTAVPTVEPLLFTPERVGETLIVIAPFFRPEGIDDHDIHHEIKTAIRQAADDVNLPSVRVEVIEGSPLRADDLAGAEALAKKYNASIVIWGADTGVRVTVNYLNLRQPDFDAATVRIDETVRAQLANPSAYASFVVHDLPHQLSFLALFAVGQSAYVRGDYLDATRIIERAITELDKDVTPPEGSAEAYFRLGWLYQEPGNDTERAIGIYDQAIKLNSQYAVAYNNRGIAHHDQGDLDAAIADYDQAIKLNPQFALAYGNRGVARADQRKFDEAIADYNEAIKLNPQFADTYNNRGLARAYKGDLNGAIADFDEAIKIDPQYTEAYVNRGVAHYYRENFDDAIANYNKAIELNPRLAEAYNSRGNARRALKDLDRAIADYDKAIELNPQYVEAYNNRAITRTDQGDLTGAIADYDQAIKLNPQNAPSYFNRGLAYQAQGQREKAIADFKKVLTLTNDPAIRQDAEQALEDMGVKDKTAP